MKKIILLTGTFIFLFASGMQKDIYLDYTNKVINYEFNLPMLNKIQSPFYQLPKYLPGGNNPKTATIKKRVKLTLISIFETKAYIKVDEYLGDQLIKSYKKWIKLDSKIFDCKLIKLTETNAVFKCRNRMLYKTINQKIPMIRDEK